MQMTSRPATGRQPATSNTTAHVNQEQISHNARPDHTNLDRPLPPLPQPLSSLPNTYEIPSLRQRPNQDADSPIKHNRSVSHQFPSIFGNRRLDDNGVANGNGETGTSKSIYGWRSGTSQNKVNKKGVAATTTEREAVTGSCMTCNSSVRWPQDLRTFRCTTCLTVNDLEPSDKQGDEATSRKPIAISLARTKKLIEHCLDTYLREQIRLSGPQSSIVAANESSTHMPGVLNDSEQSYEPTTRFSKPSSIFNSPRPVHTLQQQHNNTFSGVLPGDSHASYADSPKTAALNDPETLHPSSAGPSRETPAMIFHPLESYVTGCFIGCTTLNISFFSMRPRFNQDKAPNAQRKAPRAVPRSASTNKREPDFFQPKLDAKTLLLGDIAENSTWWTGKPIQTESTKDTSRDDSPERWRGIVSAKSPRIEWYELNEWYQAIIHAGDDWQSRWEVLQQETQSTFPMNSNGEMLRYVQQEVAQSQLHLQRVLLKATENLLKRPRRPVNSPEDCRFLLMLLANPLLQGQRHRTYLNDPEKHAPTTNKQPNPLSSVLSSASSEPQSITSRNSGVLGNHTGIVKRILGIMSNLPSEIHQFLVSWMARFSDTHLQELVDVVGSFVTYRISRQQDRSVKERVNPSEGLVPSFSDNSSRHASQLHAALELHPSNTAKKRQEQKPRLGIYSEDWQVRAAARFMSLLFHANTGHTARKRGAAISQEQRLRSAGLNAKYHANSHGQILPISNFYSSMLDHIDLIGDFEAWEVTKSKFTFCQYPFFLSIWAKIHILEHDARRQMEIKAREAFFDSILSRKAISQFLVLKVRRDCLVDDSLRSVSAVVGSGNNDIKKGLRIDFVGEEGVDAGGLRKEWFLLLVREIFDPQHGLFLYDEDSQYCYFNPFCFESSEQFFLVGILLGLAIYNSTILDVPFPPFVFKKILASAPPTGDKLNSAPKISQGLTLEDLAQYRPALAAGLTQLLEFEGDVQETFCRDFVVEMDRYGEIVQVPLSQNGHSRPVTNSNRREFVDLYVRHLLDGAVARQYEPFKRGFFTVCGGNALSLFRPEEIELLVRGSDEPLDVSSLRAVATYDNWPKDFGPPERQPQVRWFWSTFEQALPSDQRKLLSFITGSDRIPAMGAMNLTIRVQMIKDQESEEAGLEIHRFPMARTCFNTISLYRYRARETLDSKLWTAVRESEGFGLK